MKKQKHMTSRFASLSEQSEQDIEKMVEDKDSQNTKRSMKVAKELFADYVKEKKLRYFYTFRNKLSVQFIISSLRLRLIIPISSFINLDIRSF